MTRPDTGTDNQVDLHPYDGVERRYSHCDADPTEALAVIARVLALDAPPPTSRLRYDLAAR